MKPQRMLEIVPYIIAMTFGIIVVALLIAAVASSLNETGNEAYLHKCARTNSSGDILITYNEYKGYQSDCRYLAIGD